MPMVAVRVAFGLILLTLEIIGSGSQPLWASPSTSSFQVFLPNAAMTLIHCPDPAAITSWQIPRSFNAVYFAKSDEVAFSGLELAGLRVASMKLVKADVAVQGGVWRLYCSYLGGGPGLSLATSGASSYEYCGFEDHSKICINTDGTCVFICEVQAHD